MTMLEQVFVHIFLNYSILARGPHVVQSQYACPGNEIWSNCVNPCNTCELKGRCMEQQRCRPGCECEPGLFRSQQGQCVPDDQCGGSPSVKCPEDSMFQSCWSACPVTCDNPYPGECAEECVSGCYCNEGLLLRSDGKCVAPEFCSPREIPSKRLNCGDDEQYYECTPTCKNTCENFNNPGVRCGCGPPGCFCREGMVRRVDGKCVPPLQCRRNPPAPKCPANAVFIPCGSPCPPTCESPQPQSCEERCVTACFCKPGYLKSREGRRCVRPEHCNGRDVPSPRAPQCPEHSIFIRCGSLCPPTCQNMYPEPCSEQCVAGCFCKPGYYMSPEGKKCVKPEQCQIRKQPDKEDVTPKCRENAIYLQCGSACPPTCENPSTKFCTYKCVPGCFCKPGLLQTADGRCVLPQDCDARNSQKRCKLSEEEFLDCGPACQNTCVNRGAPDPASCTPRCNKGCFCRKGLFRERNGSCVPLKDCPYQRMPSVITEEVPANKTKACRLAEEEFFECGSTCPDTCDNKGSPPSNSCPYRCNRGCFCKNGYFRTRDGTCVLLKDCPKDRKLDTRTTNAFTIDVSTEVSPTILNYGCPVRTQCEAFCRQFRRQGSCFGFRRRECRCV